MKLTKQDKLLLFEQEFTAAVLIIILSVAFYTLNSSLMFYLITMLIGFALYFWMVYEEKIHKSGKKHDYFEHTSSYLMLGQALLVLALLFVFIDVKFLSLIFMILSVIMYGVSLSRIIMFKVIYKK